MSKYEELVAIQERVLDDDDYYPITDEETGKQSLGLGNAGCLKLAAELDYTHRIIREHLEERQGYVRYEFTVEIVDHTGRVLAQDVGSCDTVERPGYSHHNIRAFAKTRAWQRALKNAAKVKDRLISDLGPAEKAGNGTGPPAANTPALDGPECECAIGDVMEPRKEGGIFVCGKCSRPISKVKRIQFLSAHS